MQPSDEVVVRVLTGGEATDDERRAVGVVVAALSASVDEHGHVYESTLLDQRVQNVVIEASTELLKVMDGHWSPPVQVMIKRDLGPTGWSMQVRSIPLDTVSRETRAS